MAEPFTFFLSFLLLLSALGLYPTAASAMEIGIASGSLSSGLAVGRWGFVTTFLATAAIAWAAGVLALLGPRPRLAT